MSPERVIPTAAPADLVTFTIKADGQDIKDSYNVLSILVTKEVNKIPTAKIVLGDGDASKEDFEISNTESFVPGKEIEILSGYHSEESTIFKGIIIKHGIRIRENKPSMLVIECKDKAVKLTVGRNNAYFYESTDSDVMEEILGEYGVEAEVEATDVTHKELVQYYSTDWDFIVSRAEVNGKLVSVDDGVFTVAKPDLSQEPVLNLLYGATMLEFEAEIDARYQYTGVKSSSWDSSLQEIVESEGENPGLADPGNIGPGDLADVIGLDSLDLQHTGQVSDMELQAWADAILLKSQLSRVRGRAKFQGFSDVKPGSIVELAGVGERFNGNTLVSAVRHEITGGNWLTDVQFGLSPGWFSANRDIIAPPASGLLPAVSGLQIGIVSQVAEDPDGEDRVLVKVPLIDKDEDGVWARVACADAGEKRGIFFRPEIEDEVVLGFLNDDPRNPVILGMLNSSAKPAPLQGSDENNEKGIITRSEMKVLFDDDKKNILISTPGGNQVLLDEGEEKILVEDQSGNKIELSADGIVIESAADLELKAEGDIKIEGMNINQKAGAEFKAEGEAGAELSTGAVAVLKGSMVQIN